MREIAQLLSESDLGELSLEASKGCRLTLKRKPTLVHIAAPALIEEATVTSGELSAPAQTEAESTAVLVASPCVGVFHTPKEAVEVGSEVKAKQLLGTVESLKVPNEIYASVAGVISQSWVGDGQGVEWGQPLFEIHPAS